MDENQQQPNKNLISNDEQVTVPENKRSSRYRVLILAIVLVVFCVVVFLFWKLLDNSSTNEQNGKVTPTEQIKIANIGEYSLLNLVAKDQGYFNRHGLDATVSEYPSGPPAIADLLAKKTDFAIAADFVGVNNIFANPNLRIIAQVGSQDNFRVFGRKDKGIKDPADLKGKKIAVVRKSAGEFFLGRFLNLNGLELSDVIVTDMQPPEMIPSFKNGELPAVVAFEPHAYNLQKELGDSVVSWSAQGNQRALAVAYTTADKIKEKPHLVDHYLAALHDSEKYIATNPQGAKDILMKTTKYKADYVDYMWPKFSFGLSLKQTLPLTMEDQARFIILNKITNETKVPNYLEYIHFAGLEKLNPQLVDIEH